MPQQNASLAARLKNVIGAAPVSVTDLSDAVAGGMRDAFADLAADAPDADAAVRDVVRAIVETTVDAGGDVSAAAEATVVGVARGLPAGKDALAGLRVTADALIKTTAELGGDLEAAANGVVNGLAKAVQILGAGVPEAVIASLRAAMDAAARSGAAGEEAKTAAARRSDPVRLESETLAAYQEHIERSELAMAPSLQPEGPFLFADASPGLAALVRKGAAPAEPTTNENPIRAPKGLIHDWSGVASIPGATGENVVGLLQSYEHHKEFYRPEVIDSKLLSRRGDEFEIYLRLVKKKVITVVLDTDHHVEYGVVNALRRWCRSYTTRVAEVENAGTPSEKIGAPDTGHGFLWRLCSYWRFEEREGGVWIECRAISLTRDVPRGLGWIVEPIIRKLPRESLIATLEATRRAYRGLHE